MISPQLVAFVFTAHRFFFEPIMNRDESTKNRVLLAAGPIFARKGFAQATVREICDAANVNLASINYYFGDKQRLYIETVILAREQRAEQFPFPSWSDETLPEVKLKEFVGLMLRRVVVMQTVPWQVGLLMREILKPTEACQQLVEEYFRPIFERLLRIVDELVDRPLTTLQRTQIGFSIIGQCLHYRFSAGVISMMVEEKRRQEYFDLENLTNHITEFSIAAIRNLHDIEAAQAETTAVSARETDK